MLYRKHGHTIKSLSRVATFAKTMAAEEHRTCRTCRKMKEIQEGYDLLVRGGNAAARCSSMWADILRGEYYCGNLLWQSGLTLLFPRLTKNMGTACRAVVFAMSGSMEQRCNEFIK